MLLGVALSTLLFVPRAAKLKARELVVAPERVVRERVPWRSRRSVDIIYDFEGELFFGAAPELEQYLEALGERINNDDIKYLVLRLKRVRHPTSVVIGRIEKFVREETDRGVTVLLAGVQPDLWTLLTNVGFDEWFPSERVFPEEDEEFSATLKAVRYAHALRGFDESRRAGSGGAVPTTVSPSTTTIWSEPSTTAEHFSPRRGEEGNEAPRGWSEAATPFGQTAPTCRRAWGSRR